MRLFKYIYLIIVVVSGVFASCSKVTYGDERSICFSAYEVTAVKSSEYFSDGDAVGVFAYYLEGGAWNQEVQPDFMNNISLAKTSQGWIYSPIVFWPSMSRNQLRFYAYAPHSDKLDTGELVLSCDNGESPKLDFTVTDAKTDLLTSVPVQMSRPEGDVSVPLEFNHALGKIQFKFAVSKNNSFSYVKRISLYDVCQSAVFTWNGNDLTCSPDATEMDIHLSSSSPDGHFVNTTVHTAADEFTAYLIPGQIKEIGVLMNNNEEEIIDLTADPLEIKAGEMLSVSFTIQMSGLTVDARIVPWIEGGAVTGGIK